MGNRYQWMSQKQLLTNISKSKIQTKALKVAFQTDCYPPCDAE